ncbi:MAG: beta-ketoacyl-ACP synthase II [Oscillospiraceae bacterium]
MNRVVITGMGAVTPVGNTVADTWQALVAGKSGIGTITRFDASPYRVSVAAEVKDFDPVQYFEKTEVRKNDLYTQYAVAAAEQAMQDSRLAGTVQPGRFGVYIGSGVGGLQTTVKEAEKHGAGQLRLSPYLVPMMISNMAAGTVSIRFGAVGPTLPLTTACATSSHAIGEAYRAIKHGYADAILAGGGEATVCPFSIAAFDACMALTQNPDPATACTPFDARRSGFVMGEGGVVFVVEEYERAKARGANIYAEVCGYGNTADAHHITAPHPEAEGIAAAITNAMDEAGITPDAATYVNAHGTSTQLNDKSETLGFKKAFGPAAYDVAISSTKSMTGHMLGAAGAVEAMACIMALNTGIAPPTIGYAQPDPDCDLDYTPNTAAKRPFTQAISTSLGFGGHNACLVLKKM